LSLFDEPNLAEIASDDYPGERLVVCRNPLVAAERARKREDLVQATERALHEVEERVERGTLKGEAEIGLAVGAVWNRWRVRKHSSRCSSTTSSRPRNPTPSPKRDAQRRPSRRRAANAPRQASPATHSPRCSTNSAPAPATPSGSTKAAPPSTN